eukprot:scaffold23329_cov66-Attheya_sp.AAC.1
MEKEASAESNEESDSGEEDSGEEDDRKMPAISSKVVTKKTKHKKSQEGNNQSKLTFQYEVGERKDKKGRRSWTKKDAIMITNLATAIAYHDDTHVFAMVMNAYDIPDATAGARSNSTARGSPPEAFTTNMGFVQIVSQTIIFILMRNSLSTMKTTVRALKMKPKTILADNICTLDIDPNVVHKMRWNPTKKCFEGSNVHFPTAADVMVLERNESKGISKDDFDQCRKYEENHMDWRRLRPGHREQHDLVESEKKIHHCTQHGLFPIPQLFHALSTDSVRRVLVGCNCSIATFN